MSDVRLFDSRPAAARAESPLALSGLDRRAAHAPRNPGVVLRERAFLGHLILRGGAIVLDEALREVLDIALPSRPNTLLQDGEGLRSVQWLSPDEWLIVVPGDETFALEKRLRRQLGRAHIAIVDVSGGQTLIELSGEKAREVLMKSTPYDVHPRAFPVGKGVTTVFAKAAAVLRRPVEDRWELVVRRSFADYCYRWLLDASEEYGLSVGSGCSSLSPYGS